MELTDQLGFSLPPFQRITWVSETLKDKWESCMIQLPEMIDDVFIAEHVIQFLPVQIRNVPVHKIYEYKKKIYAKGLFAEHVQSLPQAIHYAFAIKAEPGCMPVIIGHRREVVDFIHHIHDYETATSIARLPEETIKYWEQFTNYGLKDKQWAYLLNPFSSFQHVSIFENNILNTCWANLDISAIPFNPGSLQCIQSLELAGQIREIAKKILPRKFYTAWYEILSWPAEWSALHGIAEIKTPLFKMIYNTDATGTKYTLQFRSDSYPVNGLNGLSFPYRSPDKLFFSGSEKFRKGNIQVSNPLINPDSHLK